MEILMKIHRISLMYQKNEKQLINNPSAPSSQGPQAAEVMKLSCVVCMLSAANCFCMLSAAELSDWSSRSKKMGRQHPFSLGSNFWSTPGWPWKIVKFQSRLQGPKSTKTIKHRPQNHKKHKKRFLRKAVFLQYLQCENLVLRAPGVQISIRKSASKVTWKRTRERNPISNPRCPKSSETGFPKSSRHR